MCARAEFSNDPKKAAWLHRPLQRERYKKEGVVKNEKFFSEQWTSPRRCETIKMRRSAGLCALQLFSVLVDKCASARTLNNNYCYYTWINNGHCDKFKGEWAFCKRAYATVKWERGAVLQVFVHGRGIHVYGDGARGFGRRFSNALISPFNHWRNTVIFEFRFETNEWMGDFECFKCRNWKYEKLNIILFMVRYNSPFVACHSCSHD